MLPSSVALSSAEKQTACDRALSLSFDEFKAQVVAFLMPEYQTYYGNESVWNEITLHVVSAIEGSLL